MSGLKKSHLGVLLSLAVGLVLVLVDAAVSDKQVHTLPYLPGPSLAVSHLEARWPVLENPPPAFYPELGPLSTMGFAHAP